MKKLILAAMMCLAGAVFADNVNLSQYKWAVIGDSLSDPDWLCDCGCKVGKFDHYYHFIARDTGIQVVYTNAVGSTGYIKTKWSDHDNFYNRLLERPIPSDVDVVTIMGSVNDNTYAPWDNSVGSVTDSLETSTTPAAYINKAIDVVRQQAPKAKIVLVTGLYYYGTAQEKYRRCMNILRDIAAYRGITFVDWLTPDESDPMDFSHIADVVPVATECFATRYTADWQMAKENQYKAFGHPNALYHETWLAPKFTDVLTKALTGVEPQPTESLSQYKWAVIGDEYSDPNANPKPKYVDLVSQQTGIQVVYTNAAATGYWLNNDKGGAFYQRILANPVPADTDVITLFGTMNDVSYESEKYQGRAEVVPGESGDSLPTLSYAAYVNAAIDALIRQAPKAKIILVGPLYRKGPQEYLQKNYVSDMLAKVAEYRGLEFHNWYDGMAGNPLDYYQIKSDDAFASKYVYNYPADGVAKGSWYHIPSAAYHEEFIAPEIKSYLTNALVGSGVPSVAPELGSLQIVPWGTSAAFYTTITRLGTGATAGDVYVAYGTSEGGLGEPVKIFDGATGKIDAELKGLAKNTKYYYALTFKNNAATPLTTTAITGSFTTTDEVRPDWSDKKWALIGDSISDPTTAYNGNKVSPYYNFVSRDTGIQIAYVSCIGSTGYAHDKDADPTGCPCFYKRLLNEKWHLPADADVVTIFGSANDKNWYNRIGNATDTFEGGQDSYCAYVNGTINLARQQAPNAKIILVSGVYAHGMNQSQLQAVTEAVRAVAKVQNLPFYDLATPNLDDPFDLHHMSEFDSKQGPKEGDFAYEYIIDWPLWSISGVFGHPNSLYHETYYSPFFRRIMTEAFEGAQPVRLGEPSARPSTDYNGSTVSVSFQGDLPEGAVVSAKMTLGDVDYVGTVTDGTASFTIPATVVTAGNTYDGTITVTVGGANYTKDVTLAQGTFTVEEGAEWIRESATTLNTTGTWSGAKAVAEGDKIAASNAVFTAAKPSPEKAVVTIVSTFDFGGANDEPFAATAMAGVKVVKNGGANRYAFLTGEGVVVDTDTTANVRSAVTVTTCIDLVKDTIAYTIGDKSFGPYARVTGATRVSGVRFDGAASVGSVAGSHRFEGLDTNLATVDGVKYATVAEAVAAAGASPVTLLWDASWAPAKGGDYTIAKDGFNLVIGGELAYSVKDNGDGTVTVTVAGGAEPEAPAPASITISGSKVKVGVTDLSVDCWYALEKTTDLTKPFVIDPTTWTKGSALLAGEKELVIALGGDDRQAFYRVVISTTAP